MSKYKRPDDMPGRVCRVLEGFTMYEMYEMDESPLASMVYRFCHIAAERCGNPHHDWMKEFEAMELEIEEAAYTSPRERKEKAAENE